MTRDRSFLLDRLLQYEKADATSTESEDTESSDDDSRMDQPKRRKIDNANNPGKNQNQPKKKKQPTKKAMLNQV